MKGASCAAFVRRRFCFSDDNAAAKLAVEHVIPVSYDRYPTRARRPLNSRLDLSRWRTVLGHAPAPWEAALAPVLDEIARTVA